MKQQGTATSYSVKVIHPSQFNRLIAIHCAVLEVQAEPQSKMTDTPSSVEHLSVVMTTETVDDVTQTTVSNVVTSSSRGIEFYIQYAVIVIGVVGTVANALILYALVASKQHKKHVLIFHQNALDFICSLLLIITYALKLCNFYLTGLGGYWFCMLVLSENLTWCIIIASKTNLMIVTIERYLKVVYPIWSKKKLRKWVIYSAIAFAWISAIVHINGLTYPTSNVVDGVCYSYVFYESRMAQVAYAIWYFLSFYVIILAIFIFCYWHILVIIRRQANVMASHSGPGPSTAQTQSNKIQTNVIKTMILLSAFYAISDLPMTVYILLMNIEAQLTQLHSGYYASMIVSFLYFCTNPFIYATNFDPVRRVLRSLIPCRQTPVQPIESGELPQSRS